MPTYMNLSGEAVREVVDFYDVPTDNIIVTTEAIGEQRWKWLKTILIP